MALTHFLCARPTNAVKRSSNKEIAAHAAAVIVQEVRTALLELGLTVYSFSSDWSSSNSSFKTSVVADCKSSEPTWVDDFCDFCYLNVEYIHGLEDAIKDRVLALDLGPGPEVPEIYWVHVSTVTDEPRENSLDRTLPLRPDFDPTALTITVEAHGTLIPEVSPEHQTEADRLLAADKDWRKLEKALGAYNATIRDKLQTRLKRYNLVLETEIQGSQPEDILRRPRTQKQVGDVDYLDELQHISLWLRTYDFDIDQVVDDLTTWVRGHVWLD